MKATERLRLIERIKTIEGLTDEERSAFLGLLRESKTYGLVWEDRPEALEERLREDLPVLIEDNARALTAGGPDAPNHILIEGDNLEALTTLAYTHAGKIDVIYIDPPYNTGNKDFIYNDSYVDNEDSYRHSKWLSFMSRRLKIAKKLLSDRGIIFISIDDNEQANLKLLCDDIFGLKNFVCSFIWRGGKRNMAKWVSTSHEYMLLYAKDLTACRNLGVEWHEKKKGINEIYKMVRQLIKDYAGDYEQASKALKKWYSSLPEDNPAKDHSHYSWIDQNGVYFASDISRGGGGGPQWEITNPDTGQVVKTPSRGWAYSTLEQLMFDIEAGLIHFNGNGVPCKKRYLKDNETTILETVFYKDRRASSKRLRDLMGGDTFPFPKDEEILAEKINSFSTKQSTILDFFAGSGTTLHAVMLLNAEDGGKRQCILCTNNENGICENVTYERNKRVIEGYTKPNGEEVAGLTNNNLRYYRTDFVGRSRSTKNMRSLVLLSTDMLCIKENLYAEKKTFAGLPTFKNIYRYFEQGNKKMLVIYDERYVEEIVRMIAADTGSELKVEKVETDSKIKVYVFSPSEDPWEASFEPVNDKVELCALPQAIYNTYKRILPKPKRKPLESEEEDALAVSDEEEIGGLFAEATGENALETKEGGDE